MKVIELKLFLNDFPDDMEIVNVRYNDYEITKEEDLKVIKGVPKDGWVMRSYTAMSAYNKANEKQYLCLAGN